MRVGNDAATSYKKREKATYSSNAGTTHLLQEVCRHHEHIGIGTEALDGGEVSNSFLVVFLRRHDLEDMERSPGHVVPNHLKVDELEQGGRLEVCIAESAWRATGRGLRRTDPYLDCGFPSGILSGSSECIPSHCPCGSVDLG